MLATVRVLLDVDVTINILHAILFDTPDSSLAVGISSAWRVSCGSIGHSPHRITATGVFVKPISHLHQNHFQTKFICKLMFFLFVQQNILRTQKFPLWFWWTIVIFVFVLILFTFSITIIQQRVVDNVTANIAVQSHKYWH